MNSESYNDIFDNAEEQIKSLIDPEEIVNIDIDDIESKADHEAQSLITSITRMYYDEKFMKNQPRLKNRINSDLESLRINLKMRKADEELLNILLKNIGQNPNNASLYKASTDLQRTILNITTKIEETVSNLTILLKNYQTEFNFDQSSQSEEVETSKEVHKGSKSFIESMNQELEESTEESFEETDE